MKVIEKEYIKEETRKRRETRIKKLKDRFLSDKFKKLLLFLLL